MKSSASLEPSASPAPYTGRQACRYDQLIERLAQATGVSVLLNTSFDLKGEPIVNRPASISNIFCKSELVLLALGNFFIEE